MKALNEEYKKAFQRNDREFLVTAEDKWDEVVNDIKGDVGECLGGAIAHTNKEGILDVVFNGGMTSDLDAESRVIWIREQCQLEIQKLIVEKFGWPMDYRFSFCKSGQTKNEDENPALVPWVFQMDLTGGDKPTGEKLVHIWRKVMDRIQSQFGRDFARFYPPLRSVKDSKFWLWFIAGDDAKRQRNRFKICTEDSSRERISQAMIDLYGQEWAVEYEAFGFSEDEDDDEDLEDQDWDEVAPAIFRATPLSAVIRQYGEVKWVWPARIASQVLHLVTGTPGGGKSTVLFDICQRVFHGLDFPDGFPCSPDLKGGKALLIDADDRPGTIDSLAKAYGISSKFIDVLTMGQKGKRRLVTTYSDGEGAHIALEEVLKDGMHWCLVIDTLSRYAGDAEFNSPQGINKVVKPLQSLATRLDIPVFLLGHTNASGDAYGSHIRGACQIAWKISERGQSTLRELSCDRAYAAPFGSLSFDLSQRPLVWSQGRPEAPRKPKGGKVTQGAEEWIIEALRAKGEAVGDNGGVTWKELQEAAQDSGISQTTFNRTIKSLVKSGKVQRTKSPGVGSKPVSSYSLKSEVPSTNSD